MISNMLKTFLNSTISISELTKAGAKKIFDGLNKDNSKIILRNNKPVAALISTDRYQELLEKEENLHLLELAIARRNKESETITREAFLKETGIDDEYLAELPEIEMEID